MHKKFVFLFVATVIFISSSIKDTLAQSEAPKRELSAVFTAIRQNDDFYQLIVGFPPRIRHNFGGGARFTYNLTDSIAVEGELTHHPKERFIGFGGLFPPENFGTLIGGKRTEGLFGVKAGKRMEKIGVFAKFRPGFMRFTKIPDCPGGEISRCTYGAKTEPAFDIGGVFEYYPVRQVVIRFDAGDTIIRYDKLTRANFGDLPPSPQFPLEIGGGTTHNAQFSVGVGIRF